MFEETQPRRNDIQVIGMINLFMEPLLKEWSLLNLAADI
jgi:hypothetical protein